MYDILSDIVSHCNGFIRTATTETVLEDHGRVRGTLRFN
jgi:hypothetical protein